MECTLAMMMRTMILLAIGHDRFHLRHLFIVVILHHFSIVVARIITIKAHIDDGCGRQWFTATTAAAAAVALGNVIAAAIIGVPAGQW